MIPTLLVTAALVAPAPTSGETTVRLTVPPAAAPKPALRYQLLPEVREMKAGNAAQWYLRCFAEQRLFFFSKQATAERAKYRAMSLGELAKEPLENYGGHALTQADWAARQDTIDWQVLERLQTEGTDLRLPEIGPLRVLATALQVRFRGEVARKDYANAVRTAKTMFAFARHLGENPTVQANQLGLEVANLALDTLEEMLQQPGCPNLYWALSDLPCPLVDLHKGVQGECVRVEHQFRSLRDDTIMTDEQIEELVAQLSGRVGFAREQAGLPPQNFRAALKALVADKERVASARARLLNGVQANGVLEKISALQIVGFSPTQVILLDEKRGYGERRDDEVKLLALAPWQIDALGREEKKDDGLFADFLPRVAGLRREAGRLEQWIAVLRHVEALRMYAAGHGGQLPARLADIRLPLPVDPFTGKPFSYSMSGPTATLDAGSPGRRYEITIRN